MAPKLTSLQKLLSYIFSFLKMSMKNAGIAPLLSTGKPNTSQSSILYFSRKYLTHLLDIIHHSTYTLVVDFQLSELHSLFLHIN